MVAGTLPQAGIFTALTSNLTGSAADEYVFAISGLALIVTAITAPEGITGLWRDRFMRRFGRADRPIATLDSELAATQAVGGTRS